MTTIPTTIPATIPATTGGPARRNGGQMVAGATLAASLAFGFFPAPTSSVEECVQRRIANGETRAVALPKCIRDSSDTTVPGGNLPNNSSSSDEGTSTGLLAAVGLGGMLLGAVLTVMLRRRNPAGLPAGLGSVGPPQGAPLGAPPGVAMPQGMAPPPAAVADRSSSLVTTLVDLADRVSSQALRAEILAALGRAGVRSLEPAVGEAFDATRMRGVGGTPAPDASWVGRVAATERPGFQDGNTVLRLPEVVVYTAGS